MATPPTLLPHTGTQYQRGTEGFGFDTPPPVDICADKITAATPVGSEDFGFDDGLPDQHQHGIDGSIVRTLFCHHYGYHIPIPVHIMAFPQIPLPNHTGTQYQPGTEDFGFDTPPSSDVCTTKFTATTPVGGEDFGFDSLPVLHQCRIGSDHINLREKDAFGRVNPLSSDTQVPSSDIPNACGRS